MAALRPEALSGLQAAIGREVEGARGLAGSLRDARHAMECLELSLLREALAAAQDWADRLARAGASRTALTGLAARAAGLPDGVPLSRVTGASDREGGELAEAARVLDDSLQDLAQEAAALGIAARYGAGLWGHLASLFGTPQTSYGPQGLVSPGLGTLCRRA